MLQVWALKNKQTNKQPAKDVIIMNHSVHLYQEGGYEDEKHGKGWGWLLVSVKVLFLSLGNVFKGVRFVLVD